MENLYAVSAFWSKYFYAYLDYANDGSLDPTTLINTQLSAASTAIVNAQFTPTGQYWAQLANSTPPSTPTGLTVTAVSASEIDLSWTASSYPLTIVGPTYAIFRNGVQVATTTATTYQDLGLQPSTTYTYSIQAFDAGGQHIRIVVHRLRRHYDINRYFKQCADLPQPLAVR